MITKIVVVFNTLRAANLRITQMYPGDLRTVSAPHCILEPILPRRERLGDEGLRREYSTAFVPAPLSI